MDQITLFYKHKFYGKTNGNGCLNTFSFFLLCKNQNQYYTKTTKNGVYENSN